MIVMQTYIYVYTIVLHMPVLLLYSPADSHRVYWPLETTVGMLTWQVPTRINKLTVFVWLNFHNIAKRMLKNKPLSFLFL